MSAGTGGDQAASALAAPEPTGMVQAGEGLALPRAVRQHTGRRRNAPPRAAILDVTFELLVSAAQADEHVAEVLAGFTAQRRAALRALLERGQASGDLPADADLDLLVDVAYGVLWYRLLIGHAPLDPRAARDLAAHLLAAGASGLADAAQPSRPGEGG
jgi:hypothetical protein